VENHGSQRRIGLGTFGTRAIRKSVKIAYPCVGRGWAQKRAEERLGFVMRPPEGKKDSRFRGTKEINVGRNRHPKQGGKRLESSGVGQKFSGGEAGKVEKGKKVLSRPGQETVTKYQST